MQIFNRLTERAQSDIREMLNQEPEKYEEPGYLDAVNAELNKHYAYLIVRKGDQIIYCGDEDDTASEALCRQLLEFDPMQDELEGGIYLDGENQHLIKQMDFTFPDNQGGKRIYRLQRGRTGAGDEVHDVGDCAFGHIHTYDRRHHDDYLGIQFDSEPPQ